MSREDYLKNVPFAPDWIVNPPPDIKKGSAERGNLEVALNHLVNEASSRARATLDKLSDELARESHGGRNDMLNRAAYTMGGHIATGAITRDEVEASLTMACHRNSLVADDGNAAVKKTIASGIGKGMEHPIFPADVSAANEYDDVEPSALPPKSELSLSDLTRPPGLVGDIIDWIEASSEFPSRELALGAALGWVATLAGRGFETPSRARTNLYLIALAPSGYGKDHAGSCVGSLAIASGLDRFIGPARFMSASALRETLIGQPSILCIQDEFGGILRQIDGPGVGIHSEMIRFDMLGLFSRAKDFYQGAAYAQNRAVKLFNPNLSIYGMSTPAEFWNAVTSSRNADGFGSDREARSARHRNDGRERRVAVQSRRRNRRGIRRNPPKEFRPPGRRATRGEEVLGLSLPRLPARYGQGEVSVRGPARRSSASRHRPRRQGNPGAGSPARLLWSRAHHYPHP
ncbi:hypothetical protein [Bradyrhizobium sp. AS23.2]|uniref:hypothetical protein n=1 Tax=Bradyrhizobium sp. AS23.2 TaxID=1680155 RepID=UPI000A946DCD|nr:hypothetical protein [Bradyrhizobium sp. AS23.2]